MEQCLPQGRHTISAHIEKALRFQHGAPECDRLADTLQEAFPRQGSAIFSQKHDQPR